jgi:tetratricopeptide (TPR) repeat protein
MKKLLLIALLVASACAGDPAARAAKYTASGDRYAERGEWKEAVIEYRNATKADPKAAAAYAKLGRALLKLERVPEAYTALSRAVDLNPSDTDTQLEVASILIAEGDFEGGRQRAELALRTNPSNADALVVLGTSLAGLERLDDAVSEMERAIRVDPSHAGAFTALGSLRLVEGKREEAERLLRKAAESDPTSARPRIALANLYWAIGKRDEAERALTEALVREPGNRLAHRAAAMLYLVSARPAEAERHLVALSDAGHPADKLVLAQFLAGRGRRDEAMTKLAPILKIADPEVQGPARALHARLLLAQSSPDLQGALREARKAVELRPSAAEAQYALGLALAANGSYDAADAAFAEVLRLEPRASAAAVERSRLGLARGDARAAVSAARAAVSTPAAGTGAVLQLVRSLRAAGRLSDARVELDAVARRAGATPDVQAEYGWLALAEGDRSTARKAFDKAGVLEGLVTLDLLEGHVDAARERLRGRLAERHDDPALLMLAARVELAAQRTEAAQPYLDRVIALDPRALDAYYLLADVHRRRGDIERVKAEYERAAAARPDAVVPTRTLLGLLEEGRNQPAEAERQYRAALARDRRAGVAANNLAWLLAGKGRFDEALPLAETAAQELTRRAESHHTLGWILLKTGRPAEAAASFETAVSLAPNRPRYKADLDEALS